jgi:signal transduction histidine kinase
VENKSSIQKTESLASKAMLFISIIGILVFGLLGLIKLTILNEPLIFGFLVISLIIVELYPMPVWRGFTTISFPLVYTIYIMQGLSYSIVAYALIVFTINFLKHRPLRIVFFNPAQLIISLVSADFIARMIFPTLPMADLSSIIQGIIHFTLIIIPFYLFNNLIVDFILMVRPQPYAYKVWKLKTLQELNSFWISYIYLVLFYVLGSQNRGNIDVISFFFFFSPLVALALLSSIIVRLNKEKTRLKALFKISTELNRKIPTEEWISFLETHLQEFIDVDAWTFWIKENDSWKLKIATGLAKNYLEKIGEVKVTLDTIEQLTIFHDAKKDGGPASPIFNSEIRTFLYAPLILDEEVVGLFIFGRSRTNSFQEEDIQAAATISNQLAVLIKTKQLIAEQEKSIILEERNRIAREIHDGVAQSLAGAVMKLETAERKYSKMPDDSLRLIIESKEKLRQSLKEVRESIYALRPYPTERIGLQAAIASRINSIQKENSIEILLETRGHEFPLSSMVEKIFFDIFQESVQNALKHSQASKIEILLSFQKEHALLKVKDDGVGFSLFQAMLKARREPHFGILHMNEAAEKIHASLQVDSREGAGTEIALTVPKMGIEGGDLDD